MKKNRQWPIVSRARLLGMDAPRSEPHLIPGDIVETLTGGIGVVVNARVTINGGSFSWLDALPSDIKHGLTPVYEVEFFEGPRQTKAAWWKASEFMRVVALSPVRRLTSRDAMCVKKGKNKKE